MKNELKFKWLIPHVELIDPNQKDKVWANEVCAKILLSPVETDEIKVARYYGWAQDLINTGNISLSSVDMVEFFGLIKDSKAIPIVVKQPLLASQPPPPGTKPPPRGD